MNFALVYISSDQQDYLEYLMNFHFGNLTILQIGRSEIFRELGRVFLVIDTANGATIAREFFNGTEKIERLVICGPLNFLKEAKIKFAGLAEEIYLYPEK